jgi:hypothetical protein
MSQVASISILLVAHLHSPVRITQHPKRLRREDANRRSDIISRQLPPSRSSQRVVDGERPVPKNHTRYVAS